MPRQESFGEENYRTHKFLEFHVMAKHYDEANIKSQGLFSAVQQSLKDLYVLHMMVQADLQSYSKKIKNPKMSGDKYRFVCQIFARSLRAENRRFKHLRQREINELDTYSKGFHIGWELNEKIK